MKAKNLFVFLLFLSIASKAAELRSIQLRGVQLYYYYSPSAIPKPGHLVVFMHGGVSQFMNKTINDSIPLQSLLENNADFVPFCNREGFDLIIPIAYNNFNWLDMQGKDFIDTLIGLYRKSDQKVIISGFSDGGTGAYKYFYATPEKCDGVVIFNGYPQHRNFYQNVDYLKVTDKTVVFVSQDNDKVIPYEFLLREYRRQKMVNRETYFMLRKGHHRFDEYTMNDFAESFLHEYVHAKVTNSNDSIAVYPPVDANMNQFQVMALYQFRKPAVKKYGMSETEYHRTDYDNKKFCKMMGSAPLYFFPATVTKEALMNSDMIEFIYEFKGTKYNIRLNNYFRMKKF